MRAPVQDTFAEELVVAALRVAVRAAVQLQHSNHDRLHELLDISMGEEADADGLTREQFGGRHALSLKQVKALRSLTQSHHNRRFMEPLQQMVDALRRGPQREEALAEHWRKGDGDLMARTRMTRRLLLASGWARQSPGRPGWLELAQASEGVVRACAPVTEGERALLLDLALLRRLARGPATPAQLLRELRSERVKVPELESALAQLAHRGEIVCHRTGKGGSIPRWSLSPGHHLRVAEDDEERLRTGHLELFEALRGYVAGAVGTQALPDVMQRVFRAPLGVQVFKRLRPEHREWLENRLASAADEQAPDEPVGHLVLGWFGALLTEAPPAASSPQGEE